MKILTPEEALTKAAALCAQSERCPAEIEEKIALWGIEQQADRRAIVERLTAEGYLSESRYAAAFAADKLRFNGWGRIKIALMLRQKRVSPAAIEAALAQIDEAQYRSTLQKLLAQKQRSTRGGSDYETKQKLLRFAAGRGFEPALAAALLKCDPCDEAPLY